MDNVELVRRLEESARSVLARLQAHLEAESLQSESLTLLDRTKNLLPEGYDLAEQLDEMLVTEGAGLLPLEPLEDEAEESNKQQILAQLRRDPDRAAGKLVHDLIHSVELRDESDFAPGETLKDDLKAALREVLGYDPSLPD